MPLRIGGPNAHEGQCGDVAGRVAPQHKRQPEPIGKIEESGLKIPTLGTGHAAR